MLPCQKESSVDRSHQLMLNYVIFTAQSIEEDTFLATGKHHLRQGFCNMLEDMAYPSCFLFGVDIVLPDVPFKSIGWGKCYFFFLWNKQVAGYYFNFTQNPKSKA